MIFVIGLLISCGFCLQSQAAVFYIAPHGNDTSAGTKKSPWATFTRAMLSMRPGDTLYLEDGVYHPSVNSPLDIKVSGLKDKNITFAALQNGKAVVYGDWARALQIHNQAYVVVRGINFRNSGGEGNAHGFDIAGSRHITLERLIMNGASGANAALISLAGSPYTLVEDCAVRGTARILINIYESDHVTIRRCWCAWARNAASQGDGVQVYGSNYVTVENCIIEGQNGDASDGIAVWANTYNRSADHNRILGNIVIQSSSWAFQNISAQHLITGNTFQNNVAMFSRLGIRQGGDDKMKFLNNTLYGISSQAYDASAFKPDSPHDSGFTISLVSRNNSFVKDGMGICISGKFIGGINQAYNNYFDVRVPYCGIESGKHDYRINPAYKYLEYGYGAFLMVPETLQGKGENRGGIGASILYRYLNGALTRTPLWPWPMENRIKSEFGVSPTWASAGGLWKTLKRVYASEYK